MSKVYQCDRCKNIFEPRALRKDEPYIARKGNADLDLCPKCYELLMNFLNNYDPERQPGEWRHTLTGDVICSVCKLSRRDTRTDHIQFCNHCGARMITASAAENVSK